MVEWLGCNSRGVHQMYRASTHYHIRVAGRRTSSVFLLMQIMNYNSARWKKLREKILRRDGYMCQSSLRYGRHIEADTVHHIFPASKFPEYEWEPWNLISLCAAEHNAMHIRDSDDLTDKGIKLQEKVARQNDITQ